MYMLDRYLKLLEIGIWVKIAHFLICKLAIYHETMDFSVADRTNVFLSFLVVYLTLGQILLLTALVLCLSITWCSFNFFTNVKPYKIHFTDPRCPVRNIFGRKVLISPKNSWIWKPKLYILLAGVYLNTFCERNNREMAL